MNHAMEIFQAMRTSIMLSRLLMMPEINRKKKLNFVIFCFRLCSDTEVVSKQILQGIICTVFIHIKTLKFLDSIHISIQIWKLSLSIFLFKSLNISTVVVVAELYRVIEDYLLYLLSTRKGSTVNKIIRFISQLVGESLYNFE